MAAIAIDKEAVYDKLCIIVRESGHKGRVMLALGMHEIEVFSMGNHPADAVEFREGGGAAANLKAIEELGAFV